MCLREDKEVFERYLQLHCIKDPDQKEPITSIIEELPLESCVKATRYPFAYLELFF